MSFQQVVTDLQNMDANEFQRIGVASPAVKGLVIGLVFIVIIGLGAWFVIQPKVEEQKVIIAKEQVLRSKFDSEQAKAANREAYVEQLSQMKKTFNVMLRQLPNKTDIESLLVDLSQTSVASGLRVDYFKPEREVPKEFYAEYPIKISVHGNYHEFGNFVSGLSALPRIVTLSDIEINNHSQQQNNSDKKQLTMNLTATTYRYIDEEQ